MAERLSTREFSICLLPDEGFAREIMQLRGQLPVSPYRDDTPHITLLRGISTPREMTDAELLESVGRTTEIGTTLPVEVAVREVANLGNAMYSESSVLLFEPSQVLLSLRDGVVRKLQGENYQVEIAEQMRYTPHLTVRLGVPLHGELLARATDEMVEKRVRFGEWVLFRLELENGERRMREVASGL